MAWDVLTDEQREIRELVRTLARERIAPRAAEIDESHEFPWDVVELFREHELFGLLFDEEYGGTGTGTLLALVAIEEVSKVCATSGLILAVQELGSLGLKLAGTEEQKERYLPRLASGEWLLRVRADRGRLGLRLGGDADDGAARRRRVRPRTARKRFITNAGVADLYTVFAKTDPDAGHAGISASSSSRTRPASRSRGSSRRWASRARRPASSPSTTAASPPRTCSARRARASGSRCGSSTARGPGVAAQALGIAQGATDYALEYAKTRETMGKPIARAPAHRRRSSPTWRRRARRRAGSSTASARWSTTASTAPELTKASAMAKLFCGDVAMEVTTEAVQILGGYGYIKEYPVERMMRDAKITQIYEGTKEIQRLVIAREMLRESRAFLLAGVG